MGWQPPPTTPHPCPCHLPPPKKEKKKEEKKRAGVSEKGGRYITENNSADACRTRSPKSAVSRSSSLPLISAASPN